MFQLKKKNKGEDIAFSVTKILKNEAAKRFWLHHFGANVRDHYQLSLNDKKEYKVKWNRFIHAFEHEYERQLKELGYDLNKYLGMFKETLDSHAGNPFKNCFLLNQE